ncbi:MAG: hypothetical protein E7496_12540 [Ruminococcus sp.]|nr:hypothetical protein [Ruminococcus sp.]
MTLIQAVRNYLMACPLLKDGVILSVDQLGAEISYTIDTVPCNPIIKKYTDGGSRRQFQFVFASREKYGGQVLENIENSGFYEQFSDWLEQQSWNRIFPDLGNYRTPYGIEILSRGYINDAEDDTARYQIQLNLIYYQDRRYFNG